MLGQTEIPEEMILEYVKSMSEDAFKPGKYKLFEHNCNTFSNAFAEFLVGESIPAEITNLPNDVLQTPFGQQIKAMLENLDIDVMRQNVNYNQFI